MDTGVTILRKKIPASALKSAKAINTARRTGLAVETTQKIGAATNKQHQGVNINSVKLERETDELKHATLSTEVCKLIQQARQAKGLTQKELAVKINEKPNVVNEYEIGKGIPSPLILGKLEKALGVKLRGKDKGKSMDAQSHGHGSHGHGGK